MIKIKIISNNIEHLILANEGDNLLNVLRTNGFYINASCGGFGKCKKCKIKHNGKEILSCETQVYDNMVIELEQMQHDFITNQSEAKYLDINGKYGIAIDIGTTTIAAYLVNIETKEEIDSYSTFNHQRAYGADIMTRIENCREHFELLNFTIVNQVNQIIKRFKSIYQIQIDTILASANTTMLHILVNINPYSMGVAPFKPIFINQKILPGESLNIDCNNIIVLPSISAFLGGDIVSGILACKMMDLDRNVMLVDIGTNGEIILKTKNKISGTSTAAGPAFEGANIECGLGNVNGAISKVEFENNQLSFKMIGSDVKGICGSGLVDLISILLNEELIDESGAFNYTSQSSLAVKLIEDKFYLTDNVFLSQKDIREFQLAKSAIVSGILTLIKLANIEIEAIDKVYLAGGFGFYINKKSTFNVGLLPLSFDKKLEIVGNSSGKGAKMCLLNNELLKLCNKIAQEVKTVDLNKTEWFNKYFVENMILKKI